jgi:hypothetical protein
MLAETFEGSFDGNRFGFANVFFFKISVFIF